MAATTDTLVTEFKMTGAPQLLKAINSIAAAYERMAKAQAKVAATPLPSAGGGTGGGGRGAASWTTFFANMLGGGRLGGGAIAGFSAKLAGGTAALEGFAAGFAKVTGPVVVLGLALYATKKLVEPAEQALIEYGKAIMDIRDLSGESAEESAKAHAVFQIAGINDVQTIREMLKVGKDLRSQQGAQGLALLGVHINQNDSPLQSILKISQALHDLPGGMRKAEAVAESLGIRNAAALMSLSRLTDKQKEAAEAGAFSVSDSDLNSIQDLGVQFNLVGQLIQSDLIYPFATALIPVVKDFTDNLLGSKDVLLEIADAGATVFQAILWTFSEIIAGLKDINDLWYGVFGGSPKDFKAPSATGSSASDAKTGTERLRSTMDGLQDSIDRNTDQLQANNQQLAKLSSGGNIPGGLQNIDFNTLQANLQLYSLG